MLRVLIADDNALIRKSLRKRIPWDALQMECVGEAENGREASELIDSLRPDIAITDIKMPIADGFYAIRTARERYPGMQFIVISGYDDFIYLKQSVQLQVLNYILKPIDTEELVETLRAAAAQVEAYRGHVRLQKDALDCQSLYDRQQLETLFLRFLSSQLEYDAFLAALQRLRYPMTHPFCQCVCLNAPADGAAAEMLTSAQCERIETACERICYPMGCKLVRLSPSAHLAVLTGPDRAPLSDRLLSLLRDACASERADAADALYLSCSAPVPLEKMREAYWDALFQLLHRFTETEPARRVFRGLPAADPHEAAPRSFQHELGVALDLELYDECRRIVRTACHKAGHCYDVFCLSMPQLLDTLDIHLFERLGKRLLSGQAREIYLLQFSSCTHIANTLCGLIDQLPAPAADVDSGERIVRYIHENYSKPLTLQSLSELFHMNQIYLGQLIKKKTGQTFSALLNSLRINYAAQSIRENPDISFKNLAFSLGFVDAHYFSKVFKQYHNVTPSEYRALIVKEQDSV